MGGSFDINNLNIVQALLVSLIAIAIVFLVLIVIILVSEGIGKSVNAVDAKTHINPKKANKILSEDEDAVVAALVATIDFNKETGKNAEIISITKIEG